MAENGISYGTTSSMGLVSPNCSTLSATPAITLTGLTTATKYYALLWSKNKATGTTTYYSITFTTD
jgi:hypothetical protein